MAAMDVQDIQFLLLLLLPGLVLGIIGTLMTQYLMRRVALHTVVKVDAVTTGKAAKDDDASIIFPNELYQSSSGRVHKTFRCSNMKSWQKVPACSKCFKLA